VNESQLAAGRGACTSHRTSPTSQIQTASLMGAVEAGAGDCAQIVETEHFSAGRRHYR
jgi:hypothetical protein